MQDLAYAGFQRRLMPTVRPERVIGIRTPQLRAYAKKLYREGGYGPFLRSLPHEFYEEDNLHGMLISLQKDPDQCLEALERFLPYVDNWATCDLIRPACFSSHKDRILPRIGAWMQSDHPFTIRFGIEMLMVHFLKDDFQEEYLQWVASVNSNEYYVNMMIAWYFATALAFRYEAALPYLTGHQLPLWVHHKTIQKAVESNRISPERKADLRSLRRRA